MTSTLKTEKLQFRGDNSDAITLSASGGVTVDNAHVTMGTAGKGINFSVNAGSSKTGAVGNNSIVSG